MLQDFEKMLLFKTADNDMAMFPVSALQEMNGGTNNIVIKFNSVDTDVSEVTLSVVADTELDVMKSIIRLINNKNANNDGSLLVYDKVANKGADANITDVAIA